MHDVQPKCKRLVISEPFPAFVLDDEELTFVSSFEYLYIFKNYYFLPNLKKNYIYFLHLFLLLLLVYLCLFC